MWDGEGESDFSKELCIQEGEQEKIRRKMEKAASQLRARV